VHRSCPSVCPFVCLSVAKIKKNAIFSKTKQSRATVSTEDLWSRTWAFQRTHYWTSKIQDGGDPPSWILTPKCKNAIFSKKTKQFRAMVSIGPLKYKMAEIRHLGSWRQNARTRFSQKKLSNLELWCLLTTYRKLCKLKWDFQRTHYWSLQSNMAEIRHLENRHDIILFCRGWSDLDKISRTGTEWHVDCGDVWKWKPDVEFQYGGRLGEFNPGCSHLTKAMSWSCYIAGCNNSIRHI